MTTTEAKPWENPRMGDVLTLCDGRARKALRFDTVGGYVEGVQYEITDRLGRERWINCLGSTWRRNAAAEVAKGGSYVRAAQ